MRPRPDGRGNAPLGSGLLLLGSASMRPRPDGRGNSRSRHIPIPRLPRFNEAAAGRPRKCESFASLLSKRTRFNEAAAGRPRKWQAIVSITNDP